MKTVETFLPVDAMVELDEAARYAATGVRDPDVMRVACADIERIRDQNRRDFGERDIGVELIREMRHSR